MSIPWVWCGQFLSLPGWAVLEQEKVTAQLPRLCKAKSITYIFLGTVVALPICSSLPEMPGCDFVGAPTLSHTPCHTRSLPCAPPAWVLPRAALLVLSLPKSWVQEGFGDRGSVPKHFPWAFQISAVHTHWELIGFCFFAGWCDSASYWCGDASLCRAAFAVFVAEQMSGWILVTVLKPSNSFCFAWAWILWQY